jgi:hypothetical protein
MSNHYSKEELLAMPPFDPETNPAFRELCAQMDLIQNKWGKIAGYLNYYQGTLNNALRLRGQEIFFDLEDNPDFTKWLLGRICETSLAVTRLVQERQRSSGFFIDQFSSSNCVVNMISKEMYEEFVLPFDQRFAKNFARYGIHTCNWNATPYLKSMRKVSKIGYFDMGMDTDMQKARELFPDARRAVLYSPVKVKDYPLDQITADFEKIHAEAGPCDLVLADIESDAPDDKVRAVLKIAEKISERTAG